MSRLRLIEFVAVGLGVLAERLGLLSDADLDLDTVQTRSSTEQREALMSDRCDAGLTAIDNLIAWDAQGDDLVVVAQAERTTVLDLCASPGIRSYDDLRGCELAVDAPDTGFAIVLRHVLAAHGVAADEYVLLPAGGIRERMEAILDGRAAGGLLGPPFNRIAAEGGCTSLGSVEAHFPDLPGIAVVARASRRADLAAPISAYCRALAGAADWAHDSRAAEAVGMLESAGFDRAGAEELFRVRARDVAPSTTGVRLVYDMRRELGMLSDGAPSPEELVCWPYA